MKCNSIKKTCFVPEKGKIRSFFSKKHWQVIEKTNKYPLLLICYSGNPEYSWKLASLINEQNINIGSYIHNIYSTTPSFKGKRQNAKRWTFDTTHQFKEMVPIVIRVIFRVFLLTENGSKNSNFHWVSKLSLDEQTFWNTTKILRVTITTRYLNSPSAKTFFPLYVFQSWVENLYFYNARFPVSRSYFRNIQKFPVLKSKHTQYPINLLYYWLYTYTPETNCSNLSL